MKPNEQNNRFQGIAYVFFWIRLSVFVILEEILIFLGFAKILESFVIKSLTNNALVFVMSIK